MRLEDESKELQRHISSLSDEELLTIVEIESGEYREEAVEFAKTALRKRGIAFREGPVAEEDEVEEREEEYSPTEVPRTPPICTVCGGETRFGILFAGRELTFLDPEENHEMAVDAFACRRCGRVQLLLDWRTNVLRDEFRG